MKTYDENTKNIFYLLTNQLQYLVHWQGYDVSEDSWEPAINLEHAQEIVQEYHQANPTKPKPRRRIKSRGRDSLRGG